MWIVNVEDLDALEARVREVLRAENFDVAALRTAQYTSFRQRALSFIEGYETIRRGEALNLGSNVVVLVLEAAERVLELEVYSESVAIEPDPLGFVPQEAARLQPYLTRREKGESQNA